MLKLLALALLPFMSSCCKKKQPACEPLFLAELHRDPYQVLTTDDEVELAKFGIYYDMDRNKKSK